MANQINRPDYGFKGDVPSAAIIQAYQQKAMAEHASQEQAKAAEEQKWVNMAKMVQTGADMVTKMTEQSKLKMQDDARLATQSLLARGNTMVTIPGGSEVPEKDTDAYKAELTSLLAKGYPDEFGKQGVKTALEQLYPTNGGMSDTIASRKTGIRDMLVDLPDGSQANKMIGFDAQGAYNPLDQSRVTSPEDYSRLPDRSYAMETFEDSEGNVRMEPKSRSGKFNTGGSSVPERERGKITDINLLPKKQATDANLRLKDAIDDPIIKNAKSTALMITNVEKLLAEDNKIAIDRLGGLTQKLVALDSGNLAAWEQRDPNSRAYIDRLKQFVTMGAKGKLSKEAKAELQDLLKITKSNLLQNMDDAAEQRLDALVETYPRLNKEAMRKKLGTDSYRKRLGTPSTGDYSKMSTEDLFKALTGGK